MSATLATPSVSPATLNPLITPVTGGQGPPLARATAPRFGDPVEGRDGPLGTVAGTRPAVAGEGSGGAALAFLLVRRSRAWGLWHRTYAVPLSWMRERRSGFSGVTLDASVAEVVGCPVVRADREIRADVVDALWPQGVSALEAKLRIGVRDGVVHLSGHSRHARDTRQAEATSWRVPGVLGVRSSVTDDEALAGAVAQALTTHAGTRGANLIVHLRLGSVDLDGLVPDQATLDAGTALARAVPSVESVRNGARIAAAPAARAATLADEAK